MRPGWISLEQLNTLSSDYFIFLNQALDAEKKPVEHLTARKESLETKRELYKELYQRLQCFSASLQRFRTEVVEYRADQEISVNTLKNFQDETNQLYDYLDQVLESNLSHKLPLFSELSRDLRRILQKDFPSISPISPQEIGFMVSNNVFVIDHEKLFASLRNDPQEIKSILDWIINSMAGIVLMVLGYESSPQKWGDGYLDLLDSSLETAVARIDQEIMEIRSRLITRLNSLEEQFVLSRL